MILDANKGYLRAGFDEESGELRLYDSAGNSLTGDAELALSKTDPTTGHTVIVGPDGPITTLGIRSTPVRVVTLGDSTANLGNATSPNNQNISTITGTVPASGVTQIGFGVVEKAMLPMFYPMAQIVGNFGISGETPAQIRARDALAFSEMRKATADVLSIGADLVIYRGIINGLNGITEANYASRLASIKSDVQATVSRLTLSAHVLFEGSYGFDYTWPNPDLVRQALLELDLYFAEYFTSDPAVSFQSFVGITCDAEGRLYPWATQEGLHLNFAGGAAVAKIESEIVTRLFGASAPVKYKGQLLNTSNPTLALTNAVAYGQLAAGIVLEAGGGAVLANAKSEIIAGKLWQTVEVQSPNAAGYSTYFIEQLLLGAIQTFSIGDVLGLEVDVLVEPVSDPEVTGLVSNRFTLWGGGRLIAHQIASNTAASRLGGIYHLTIPPIVMPNLSTVTKVDWAIGVTNLPAGGVVKLGISAPRAVKLN